MSGYLLYVLGHFSGAWRWQNRWGAKKHLRAVRLTGGLRCAAWSWDLPFYSTPAVMVQNHAQKKTKFHQGNLSSSGKRVYCNLLFLYTLYSAIFHFHPWNEEYFEWTYNQLGWGYHELKWCFQAKPFQNWLYPTSPKRYLNVYGKPCGYCTWLHSTWWMYKGCFYSTASGIHCWKKGCRLTSKSLVWVIGV